MDTTKIISDPTIAAYLELKGYKITPQRNPNSGQVEFIIAGEQIDEALTSLFQNPKIHILDYLRCLKGLRAAIFALKGGKNEY